jgi:tRNA A-37 threonylcarbamoyl transferase component Bud32
MAAAPELKTLGRYNLERVLGKGAMGVVYEGVDPRLNRRVAIKTILKSNLDEDTAKDFAMRFVREAQAVARLNHPNIVQVYDFGEEGDVAYLVMEFIRGKELKNFFDANERFDLKEAVRIMGELCEALEFAHQAGIVHRDIKPANVMIDSQARTKLTDFGVARVQDSDKASVEKTQAGTMVGTPAYMSPEQITGGNVDKRSDVFSAGIILYQFLTGEKPFSGGGAWTIAKKIIQEDPPAPSSINNAVTPLFDAVVNKALAKNPEERYQTARDLAVGLKRALEGKPADDDADKTVVGAMPEMPKVQPRPAAAAAKPGATAGTAGSQAGSQEVELEFWRAIKDGNDPDDFDLYVQQFPTGIYAALAKRKAAKLRGVVPEETGVKAREQEKKEAEEAANAEAAAREKLAEEKTKLEAQLARKEEEYKKREAEAEAQRAASEKARLEAIEKAKQEAAAEVAKREAEYKKREAEAEAKHQAEAEAKAKKDAEARAKSETEAKAKREADEKARREAEDKARKEAEAKSKKDAEERGKREAEYKKRDAELKAREADATLLASGKKKSSPVVPIVVGVVVAAIGGGLWFFGGSSDDVRVKALQTQLEDAKKREAELAKAKAAEEQARIALEKARAAEAEARKSGDLKQQKELAEARVRAETEARKQTDSAKVAQAAQAESAKKADEAKRVDAEKRKTESAKQAQQEKQAQERQAAEQKAATDKAAASAAASQEKAAAAERAAAERIAAAEKAAQEKIAAAEKAAAERAQQIASAAPGSGAAPSSGEQLFAQAAGLEREGKGAEAVRTYTRAARSGSGKAAKRLGEIYDKGVPGVSRDYAESLKWYNTARALGEEIKDARR